VIDEAVSLPAGTPIEVVAVEGLRLKVRPLR
jgi:membrane protein implicated in regulation of membrane protease activity